MEEWIREILEKEDLKNVEVKKIGKNYYVYEVSSVYDREKKRPRKISGIIKKVNRNVRTVFRYGNSKIIYDIIRDIEAPLRKYFESANEIMAMASVRVIRNVPLKYINDAYSKLYMSNIIDASLSHSTIAQKLRDIRSDTRAQHEFFRKLISDGNVYLYNLSSIFSYSENTNLAE